MYLIRPRAKAGCVPGEGGEEVMTNKEKVGKSNEEVMKNKKK